MNDKKLKNATFILRISMSIELMITTLLFHTILKNHKFLLVIVFVLILLYTIFLLYKLEKIQSKIAISERFYKGFSNYLKRDKKP